MVRWTYSGIRPLYDDGASKAQEATRDYVLKLDAPQGEAPLLSVFGGKITTFRKLAEAVMEKIGPFFPGIKPAWTAAVALPGGDFPYAEVESRIGDFQRRYSFLTPRNARRIFSAYGTRAERFLEGARLAQDLGENFRSAERAGSRLSGAGGMGAERRRHSVAAIQARAASVGGRAGGAQHLYEARRRERARSGKRHASSR